MRRARWVIGIGMGEDRSDPTACRNVEISSNKCDPASAGMREALRLAISRSAGARCMSLSFYELYLLSHPRSCSLRTLRFPTGTPKTLTTDQIKTAK